MAAPFKFNADTATARQADFRVCLAMILPHFSLSLSMNLANCEPAVVHVGALHDRLLF
jgi:hypothetical protein